jgi:hypothetical protein
MTLIFSPAVIFISSVPFVKGRGRETALSRVWLARETALSRVWLGRETTLSRMW